MKLSATIGEKFIATGLTLCFFSIVEPEAAERLNEWMFEQDAAGRTLYQATNSGTDPAVFASGGEGFLETDGVGNLRFTHTGGGTNGLWTSGAIVDAALTNTSSTVQYVRYDLDYHLGVNPTNGTVLGLYVVDSSGNQVAGVAVVQGSSVSSESNRTVVATDLESDHLSIIAKVDIDNQQLTVWYDPAGANRFDENNPSATNIPIQLTSIDKLRFQATGDVGLADSTNYVAVDNIRMASTWNDIAGPVSLPLSVNALFHDKMVLQRESDAPVWGGSLTPGRTATVRLDGTVVGTAVADSDGRWLARIGSHADDGGVPHTLTLSAVGETDINIQNVVFGDVYLASGQSNMQLAMDQVLGYSNELAAADAYPLIRQVRVYQNGADTPQEEAWLRYDWTECSAASLSEFTAVGYFFAKSIYLETGIPIGLVNCSWGGQKIERFLSPSGMTAVPELAGLQQQQEEGGITNSRAIPHEIYNAMIASLIPYGVRGAIWYQGEANTYDDDLYQYKMKALMRGWRENWGQGDFSFYYVQLPNYNTAQHWPEIREAQTRVLSETNTGMAVTIDVGDPGYLHPTNKYDVGRRLAQWALAKDFDQNLIYSGPLFRKAMIEDSQIRIVFDYAESGLIAGWKPENSTNSVMENGGPLQNFEIAGLDKIFVDATAVIDRDTVLISSPQVSDPVYVRYCYASQPSGTNKLYNAAELPAVPFRTDESYLLTVVSGSGTTAGLAPGVQVDIVASNAPAGKVFDRWIGAASEIDQLNSATATVTMPAHALYLLASYRDIATPVYTLTVNGGSGSGTSQFGSILNIEAASPPAGKLFDCWSGDTQNVVNVEASSTTLRMPAGNVTVTAVYRTEDSVGDGIADTWRALYFGGDGRTTNSQSASDADFDEDGASNLQEYYAGTSPVDAQSVLRLRGAAFGENMTVSFPSVAGNRYRLKRTDNLINPAWETVFYNITGDGMQKQVCMDTRTFPNGFYRLWMNMD